MRADFSDVFARLLLDHIRNVVGGNNALHAPCAINHGNGEQAMLAEKTSHELLIGLLGNRNDFRSHHIAHKTGSVGRKQVAEAEDPEQLLRSIQNVNVMQCSQVIRLRRR